MVASYRYNDPYGQSVALSGSLAGANEYRFSSKERHAQSAMYYYGYRFYDPSLQRWINRDTIGEPGFEAIRTQRRSPRRGEPNRYLFVVNNPIQWVDYLGLWHLGGPSDSSDPDSSVVCDGHGGIEVHTGPEETGGSVEPGIMQCMREHEERHAQDILAQQPGICLGAPQGTEILPDTMEELNETERNAFQDEMSCLRAARCNSSGPRERVHIENRLDRDRRAYLGYDKRHGGRIYRY